MYVLIKLVYLVTPVPFKSLHSPECPVQFDISKMWQISCKRKYFYYYYYHKYVTATFKHLKLAESCLFFLFSFPDRGATLNPSSTLVPPSEKVKGLVCIWRCTVNNPSSVWCGWTSRGRSLSIMQPSWISHFFSPCSCRSKTMDFAVCVKGISDLQIHKLWAYVTSCHWHILPAWFHDTFLALDPWLRPIKPHE